ncbi:MAG: hypothetical protein KJO84_00775, partial [Acidimicrobiia bacterium]|nr:hypothetical protein [Acidimicrobiia bacterium]
MKIDRGSALLEVLVGGGLVVALLVGLIVGAARLQWASERAFEAAAVAATTAALRGADAGEAAGAYLAPDGTVSVTVSTDLASAEVAIEVHVVGFGGFAVRPTV